MGDVARVLAFITGAIMLVVAGWFLSRRAVFVPCAIIGGLLFFWGLGLL